MEILIYNKDSEQGKEKGQHTMEENELQDYSKNQFLADEASGSTTT